MSRVAAGQTFEHGGPGEQATTQVRSPCFIMASHLT